MKLCTTCTHFSDAKCWHPQSTSLITGELGMPALDARAAGDLCGPEGRLWLPKPLPMPEPPQAA